VAIKSSKNKKGNKKHGRNKAWCLAYRLKGRREKNKAKLLDRHLARFPDDAVAKEARKGLL
jgi:hypothetical protein